MSFAPEVERTKLLEALTRAAAAHPGVKALWLQGSLARGDADAQSDIDAYLAVADDVVDAFFAERLSLLEGLGHVIVWNDLASPAVRCVHALFATGVRLDLFVEASSTIGEQPRPAFVVLLDKDGSADRLREGWSASAAVVGRAVLRNIRFTRQGALWPARVLGRSQWSTFAMLELDLINAQLAQLMVVQIEPEYFHQHVFTLPRRLPVEQRRLLDRFTGRMMDAAARRDAGLALAAHLEVYDAHVREARAACAALAVPYPLDPEDEATIRALTEAAWPT